MARKWFGSVWLLSAASLVCGCQSRLQTGDLLFHVVTEDNAITSVTPGMIDHVAISIGGDSVIEAIPRQGVTTTPLRQLRERETGHYVVARVHGADRRRSVARARSYLGLPYDSLYLPDARAIYCSELVQLAFVDRHGQQLFQPIPMSFHDASGRITDYWRQFYARHGMDVPEGLDGTNPGELSRRPGVSLKGTLK